MIILAHNVLHKATVRAMQILS